MTVFHNIPFDRLTVGMEARAERLCRADDLYVFAHASGNLNPLHIPDADGDGDGVPEAVAPSAWVGALISAVLGNQLPGPGTIYESQTLRFVGRATEGDTLHIHVRVTEKMADRRVRFDTRVSHDDGTPIVTGEAVVTAPMREASFDAKGVPGLGVYRHRHFDALLARAAPLEPIRTAVVAPEEPNALAGALAGFDRTIITPILVGDPGLIAAAALELGRDLSGFEIVAAASHADAAAQAVALVHGGQAQALMKGHLHTDVLLSAVLKRDTGLRTDRRLSHCFVFDVPGLPHLLTVTDAAINIAPDLETKVDIVQNAIGLMRALGVAQPKAGILSAVETVNPRIPSTLDAAILSKMAERGQITGGLVDGPLALDNAMDMEAARTKGITSMVAGRADILVVPNLEAGNMLAKELTFAAHAEGGGVVLGAACPIILTSRADGEKARLASCAIAALAAPGPSRA
ncbi:bifunctional enoyl-CoA hydratase/phosphate acetyltransferase [Meridianimarinicoccus sp. RP-17]|uniref:bifunctional enoyl-CoA hydratase/phosphate acetyltransferase n=1 Tax=Meridianimarinicoccus zhengii TaxID=2056810 RepID=UPI000DAEB178|nr:bifunctional enoyl-CoA hydratase/phosphate acetyltransferase [Phycocomes zhengii]